MKLDKYLEKLKNIQYKYGIAPVGLLILGQFLEAEKTEDEVTIMNIIEHSPHASQATVHKYLHALLDKKILAMQKTTDARKKILVKGKKFEEFENFVGGC